MNFLSGLIFLIQLCIAVAQDFNITRFNIAVEVCGWNTPENLAIYHNFIEETKDFTYDREKAMFLAQLISSTDGFQFFSEINCPINPSHYNSDINKSYQGRGFLKLVGADQYRLASEYLYRPEILAFPELVASDMQLAMKTSAWFWKFYVRPVMGRVPHRFGSTTKAIAERIAPGMCNGLPNQRAKNRYDCYLKVAGVFNIVNKASEEVCYN